MFERRAKGCKQTVTTAFVLICVVLGPIRGPAAEEPGRGDGTAVKDRLWDPNRYIALEQIKAGMEGYCLTEYGVAGIERFGLVVVDVVRDFEPGRDVILVKGTDERFIHTGPVAGCSGSPVYIDGRLAGALAYAWMYSKDPLYGATPIAEMLKVGTQPADRPGPALVFDYSSPIDLAEVDEQISASRFSGSGPAGAGVLPCPLLVHGLPPVACEQLDMAVRPLGLTVVAGAGPVAEADDEVAADEQRQLVPGACLAVPLVSGDISMGVYGTVTEVRGRDVYGFGHSYLGYGQIDLPMATGKVHTVISSLLRSSKMARVVKTVGALRNDEGAGVLGKLGAEARTLGLTIRVDRYNDRRRVYNCRVAHHRILSPSLLRSVITGAALYLGDFPPDHTLEYEGTIAVEGFEPIRFGNVSTGLGLAQLGAELSSSVALLLNNPYAEALIGSVEFDIRILPKDITSHIWSANVLDAKVKAGQRIVVEAVIESVRTDKRRYRIELEIPSDLAAGTYELTLSGSQDYEQFLVKAVPYRFVAQSLPGLVEALRRTLDIKRDKLYCYLTLPAGGMVLETAELPDLPATKMLVLQSTKRPIRAQLYPHWVEKTVDTGTVIINKRTVRITVER